MLSHMPAVPISYSALTPSLDPLEELSPRLASFCADRPHGLAQTCVIRMAALQGVKPRPNSLALALIIVYVSPTIPGESSLAHPFLVPPLYAQQATTDFLPGLLSLAQQPL